MTASDKAKIIAPAVKKVMTTQVSDQGVTMPSPSTVVKKRGSKTVAKVAVGADELPVKAALALPVDAPAKATTKAKTAKKKSEKPVKVKKSKLGSGNVCLHKEERRMLRDLKKRAAELARPVKKSALLCAGIKALAAMSDAAFLASLKGVSAVKSR